MFTMRRSKTYCLVGGILCLVGWPGLVAAFGDWRIAQAQERLKAVGFDPLFIDGLLGPRSKEALRRYQASQALPMTGVLDEATRRVLLASDRTQPGSEAKPELLFKAPPGGVYKKLSSLAQLPDYLPGLGTRYVDAATLPAGPLLAYDRQGNFVSSV
jgi:peptidoglycan hydrolase-like protein with peptidoglycan-binding domain